MLRNAPCKDCNDRHETCHSSCSKYQEYLDYKNYINEIAAKEKMIDATLKHLEENKISRMRLGNPNGLKRKKKTTGV